MSNVNQSYFFLLLVFRFFVCFGLVLGLWVSKGELGVSSNAPDNSGEVYTEIKRPIRRFPRSLKGLVLPTSAFCTRGACDGSPTGSPHPGKL